MKIKVFNQLWQEKHPGSLVQAGEKGGVELTYSPEGKIYRYKGSIYSIAERLGLIPEVDYEKLGSEINLRLVSGEREVVAPAGCGDTCRHTWQNLNSSIEESSYGRDEYDRELSSYTVLKNEDNPWI